MIGWLGVLGVFLIGFSDFGLGNNCVDSVLSRNDKVGELVYLLLIISSLYKWVTRHI